MDIMSPLDPTEAFARFGRINLRKTGLDGVLAEVAALTGQTVPGSAEVSVTLVRSRAAHTAAFTGDLARALDELQYERGHGPCLEASASAAVLSVPEMTSETRWPDWTARCLDAGIKSTLSIGLPVQDAVSGALNLYATEPHAFDDDAIAIGQTFAGYAAIALANADLYDSATALARHLQIAMESRAVIEQAKGIIMGERRCSPDEAFRILSRVSQQSNRKLRDVAAALVHRATGSAVG